MKAYKLTDPSGKTYEDMLWEIGKTNVAKGKGSRLCTDAVLHAYRSPLLAAFFNPIHVGFESPRLFEISCSQVIADDGTKIGTKQQTPVCELPVPHISTNQRVCAAILIVRPRASMAFNDWAENWLDGSDRSVAAAQYLSKMEIGAAQCVAYAARAAGGGIAGAEGAAACAASAVASAAMHDRLPLAFTALVQRAIETAIAKERT